MYILLFQLYNNISPYDIEFSKKKRCRKIILSESSDDESVVSNTEINLTSDDLIKPLFNEPEPTISTQQLMGLCSGEFHTQNSEPPEV